MISTALAARVCDDSKRGSVSESMRPTTRHSGGLWRAACSPTIQNRRPSAAA